MLDSGRFLPTQAEMLDSHSKVVRKFGCFPLNLRAGGVLECFMRPVPIRLHEPLLSLALPHSRLTNIPLITLSYEALTGRVLFGLIDWLDEDRAARAGLFFPGGYDANVRFAPNMFDEDMLRTANSLL
ncbi:MAG: hypothetical protein AAGA78_01340 [Pseudomonadota bacterium]